MDSVATSFPNLNTIQALVMLENHITNSIPPAKCVLTMDFPLLLVFGEQGAFLVFHVP